MVNNKKIVSGADIEPNSPHEIFRGGPLSRCIGDLRFKQTKKFAPDRQAVIAVPEVKELHEWRANDFILLGSSGFWDLTKCHSKNTIDLFKKNRFAEALAIKIAHKMKKSQRATYQESDEILEDVLKIHINDLIAKTPPVKGEPPKEQSGANKPGY